jgi:hypothetical protein
MKKAEAIQTAKAYFENHSVDSFFITDDGQVFFDESHANNHATSLGKDHSEVVEVSREEAEQKAKAKGKKKADAPDADAPDADAPDADAPDA